MTDVKMKISDIFAKYKEPLARFFSGRLYPFIIAALVLIGHTTGLEFYLNFPIILSASLSLIVCDSIKPFLPTLLTFLYQINLKHSPGVPYWSDYYSRPEILTGAVIVFVILGISLIYFTVKNIVPKIDPKHIPLIKPISVLSVAFLLNGMFSEFWVVESLVWGIAQILVYLLLFYILYYGIEGEDTDELISHLCYLALLVGIVLVGEMAFVYLTYDNLYDEAGSVIKESIVLGWGVCNPIGYSLGVLIPILMLGAMRERFSIIYFAGAIICWGTAIITLSRNALLFATLFLGISVISGCFIGKRKKLFRIMTAAAAVMGVIVFILIFGKLKVLLIDFVNRGLSDTGRFELWKLGIENFKQYPIFGTGFFGYNDNHTFIAANFLPTMAHNTIVQLLSSMGIFGLLAYLYYRVSIFIPIIRKITTEKYMLMLSLLYTMASSLLDNFVFYIYTVFLYAVILAILVRISEKQKKEDTQ